MSSSQKALENWLNNRAKTWQELELQLPNLHHKKNDDKKQSHQFIQLFRSSARDLSLAREIIPGNRINIYLENIVLKSHSIIYRKPQSFWRNLVTTIVYDVPQNIRLLKSSIFAVIGLFISAIIAGWLLVNFNHELASLFASSEMINKVQQGELWTDDLLNILPSSILSISIMTNNVIVSLTAFGLGVFYGLGTLYIMLLNGLMLGGIFAYVAVYNLDGRLFEFIIAHGVVELSVICLSGAAGVQLGEAIIRPGSMSRTKAFQKAVYKAGTLLVVAIPFLM
ncbi:MAG: stage II sporulation protein M, partial [Methylococcales bacterium]|nr:stage II sporulation protein M [Methylococcales bacterium]